MGIPLVGGRGARRIIQYLGFSVSYDMKRKLDLADRIEKQGYENGQYDISGI